MDDIPSPNKRKNINRSNINQSNIIEFIRDKNSKKL